jgi:hypothetical protein
MTLAGVGEAALTADAPIDACSRMFSADAAALRTST